jgi:hypothetical protein
MAGRPDHRSARRRRGGTIDEVESPMEEVMKRMVSFAVFVTVLAGGVAMAQQPAPRPPDQRQEHHMHGGVCPMMGQGGMMQGGMPGGMMGMMGGQADPRMMQMRGEMMKAMGDVMIKYGKQMEGAGR